MRSGGAATQDVRLHATVLCTTGRWLIQTGSESSTVIRHSYLKAACDKVDARPGEGELRASICYALATHADALHAGLVAKLESPEWKAASEARAYRKNELAQLEKLAASPSGAKQADVGKLLRKLRAQVDADNAEVATVEARKREHLVDASRYYIKTLAAGDKHVHAIFQLCNLWFNDADNCVSAVLAGRLASIPSPKWLPLSYQVASRLGSGQRGGPFRSLLERLLLHLAEQHPHHLLFKLVALVNGGSAQPHQSFHVIDDEKIEGGSFLFFVQAFLILCSQLPRVCSHRFAVECTRR